MNMKKFIEVLEFFERKCFSQSVSSLIARWYMMYSNIAISYAIADEVLANIEVLSTLRMLFLR